MVVARLKVPLFPDVELGVVRVVALKHGLDVLNDAGLRELHIVIYLRLARILLELLDFLITVHIGVVSQSIQLIVGTARLRTL